MKKIFFVFVFLLFPFSAYAGSFPDVAEDHKNFEAIEYLDDNGVINGYQDGTFGPDNLVTRAEAAKIIVNAFDLENTGSYDPLFPDVNRDDWFFDFVMAGREGGIIDGHSDGTFKPNDSVNLAETLKMIMLATGEMLPAAEDKVFTDVSKDLWYAPHALYARNHNIILADDYGEINADQSMTRAYFAEVIYRTMIVMDNNGDAFPLHNVWSFYESNKLPFSIKYDEQDWEVIVNENEVIFFKPDREFLQASPVRDYPNSAYVWVVLDENEMELSSNLYFDNLKSAFTDANITDFSLNGFESLEVLYPQKRTVDWYVFMDDSDVLQIFTGFGNGVQGFKNQQYIKSMLSTLDFVEVSDALETDYDDLLSEIFEVVLVEQKGMEALNKLPDKLIIETDSVGVGTGPVDYYFSEGVDYTFKYERASDVILDTREGRTTAF